MGNIIVQNSIVNATGTFFIQNGTTFSLDSSEVSALSAIYDNSVFSNTGPNFQNFSDVRIVVGDYTDAAFINSLPGQVGALLTPNPAQNPLGSFGTVITNTAVMPTPTIFVNSAWFGTPAQQGQAITALSQPGGFLNFSYNVPAGQKDMAWLLGHEFHHLIQVFHNTNTAAGLFGHSNGLATRGSGYEIVNEIANGDAASDWG